MLVLILLIFALPVLVAAAHLPHRPRQSPGFDISSLTGNIPSLCIAQCAPTVTYWDTNAETCSSANNLNGGLACLSLVCSQEYFSHISNCVSCVLQAVPDSILGSIVDGVEFAGELCRLTGFNVGLISGTIDGAKNATSTNATSTITPTSATVSNGTTIVAPTGAAATPNANADGQTNNNNNNGFKLASSWSVVALVGAGTLLLL